jgi:S-adenosylmethionine-diacylglycerol 3-amino-3-carboxypropyl transferase
MIASGGCTALTLQAIFPGAEFTLLDPNPAQLNHVRAKMDAVHNTSVTLRNADFNVEHDDSRSLSECGNFESLFRGLRRLLHDLVLPYEGWRRYFTVPGALGEIQATVFDHPYWPVVFEMYFGDPLLEAMFGPDATQHAEPRSYPGYFRNVFERGLERDTAIDNPFLHHVFLGHYLDRPACLPGYLSMPAADYRFRFVEGYVDDEVDLGEYDFIGLSNILDWMAPAAVHTLLDKVARELQPGSVVMWRQLNNKRDLAARLRQTLDFDDSWCRSLQARDRSLFYSSIHVGVRAGGG